ncbi:hypothetical protein [Adonisia turfae]|uniref:Uncharacterized protein n=1 Tax=Adonisia turfae CCMR0081 TaxID=2292702 RepID=A0A6M0RF11_9CYAN|nr:hypothetical protein [Adonisia turfae]NEZ54191.1 hypothetical protein [Adonisia turfae CCMR0081]
MEQPTTIKLEYPEWMSDAEKQAMDDKLNALFENRAFTSEAEMEQAIQEAVKTHLGMEMQFTSSPAQLWLERVPLILSVVILVLGLYRRYGLGQ